jgi:hypothetical protein
MGLLRRSGVGVNVGGRFAGVSTRADGKTRANFLNDPATGRDRRAVKAVKKATKRGRS